MKYRIKTITTHPKGIKRYVPQVRILFLWANVGLCGATEWAIYIECEYKKDALKMIELHRNGGERDKIEYEYIK